MNKQDVIDGIASRAGLSKHDSERSLNAFLDVVTDTLAGGGDVSLVGFGKFHVSYRKPRAGINPRTGEALQIAAANVPKFTAGASLKASVNARESVNA